MYHPIQFQPQIRKSHQILKITENGSEQVPQQIAVFGRIDSVNHRNFTVNYGDTNGDGIRDIQFQNPIVIASPISFNGGDAAVARVSNVTGSTFDIKIQETDFLPVSDGSVNPGGHVSETVHYMVVEAGTWQLDDGSLLKANTLTTNQVAEKGFEPISFGTPFEDVPIVLSQTQTIADQSFVFTRQRNLSSSGFEIALQEEERNIKSGHAAEVVGYLAFDPISPTGVGAWNGNDYLANRTQVGFDHRFRDLSFESVFEESPNFVAQVDSFYGADPAFLRYRNIGAGGVKLRVQEDLTKDLETGHLPESVSYFAIEGSGVLSAIPV